METELTGIDLKELREKFNLTQIELSEKTFIDRATLSRWENGRQIPKPYQLLLELFFEKLGKNN